MQLVALLKRTHNSPTAVMSDSIPTPSQTQGSEPVPNDAFGTLIDLLTSDDIDETLPEDCTRPQDMSWREPSGKLVYDKIYLMFASQHAQKPPREERKWAQSVQAPTLLNDEGDSEDKLHSPRSPSTASSRSQLMSPKPVKHTTAGHMRSSTFGNHPWTPIHGYMMEANVVSHCCHFWNK